MSTFETILPNNATKLEKDLERAASFESLPIEALGSLSDPAKIDSRLLPWLAFRFGADIWSDDWTTEKKRDVVSKQFDLHRLKGTEAGISAMLDIVDSTLRETLSYPQRVFASAAITKEQRNAWLSRMPQIRIYFASMPGVGSGSGFAGEDGRARGAFVGRTYARFDAGEAIYGRRAVLRAASGAETPLRRSRIEETVSSRESVDFDRVHIPGNGHFAAFVRGFCKGRFLTVKNKQAEVVTVALDRSYDAVTSELHLDTVTPGLDPIDVKYERESDRIARGPAAHVTDFAGRRFVMRDDAANHIYDRIFLHDPTVDTPWTKAHSFVGHARVGIRPFHAEMMVEARSSLRRLAGHVGKSFMGRFFATKENLTKTKLAYAAVRRSKALRDRVLVETQTTRRIKFGDGFKFGDGIKFGSTIRNRLR